MISLKHILVATDFSEASDAACAYGRELASRFGATLHVLHVVQTFPPGAFGTEGFSVIGPELQQQMEGDARRRLVRGLHVDDEPIRVETPGQA